MLRTCRIMVHLKTAALGFFSYFQYLFFQLALVEAKLSITDDKLLNSAKEVTLLISLNTHTFFLEKEKFSSVSSFLILMHGRKIYTNKYMETMMIPQ